MLLYLLVVICVVFLVICNKVNLEDKASVPLCITEFCEPTVTISTYLQATYLFR